MDPRRHRSQLSGAADSPNEHHHSAGGVVVDGDRVLLISTRGGTRWQLPKGHLEAGETERRAAVREVLEEGGVVAEIVDRLDTIRFHYQRHDGTRIDKRVDYFLMRYRSDSPRGATSIEVSDTAWFPWREARRRLFHENERALLEAAEGRIAPQE